MAKQDYVYFDHCLMKLVDLSIDIFSKSGRTEFFYFLSEEEMKKDSHRQRFSTGFVKGFTNYFNHHNVKAEYVVRQKAFKVTLDLLKCVLDVPRFELVTKALKNPVAK